MSLDDLVAVYSINSFATTTTATVEVHTSIATPGFTASYSSTPSSAVLTDDQGTAAKTVTSTPAAFTSNGTFVKDAPGVATFTLSAAGGGSPTKTRIVQIAWYQRIHYGTGAPGLRSAAAILALASNPLAGGRGGAFGYAAGNTAANLKCYYAIPTGFGTPVFKSGGLPFAIARVATAVSVTSNGLAQTYDLYESDNVGLGTFTLDVT